MHHLSLNLQQDLLLLCEYLEAHGHHVHERDARTEPEDLPHEGVHDEKQLVSLVDQLVKLIFAVVLDQFRDLFLLLLRPINHIGKVL